MLSDTTISASGQNHAAGESIAEGGNQNMAAQQNANSGPNSMVLETNLQQEEQQIQVMFN
jgi:hypothetical protein